MICDSCGKNEANFHYTKIINGKMEEEHLCKECAFNHYDFDLNKPLSMDKFFTGLIDNKQESKEDKKDIKCRNCGLTYSEFKERGEFGCSKCYIEFKDKVEPLIRSLHGHNIHRGKIPKSSDEKIFLKREEKDLNLELESSIKREEFERAAVIRDELKDIRAKLKEYEG
jgi:protein arginine kinase activator